VMPASRPSRDVRVLTRANGLPPARRIAHGAVRIHGSVRCYPPRARCGPLRRFMGGHPGSGTQNPGHGRRTLVLASARALAVSRSRVLMTEAAARRCVNVLAQRQEAVRSEAPPSEAGQTTPAPSQTAAAWALSMQVRVGNQAVARLVRQPAVGRTSAGPLMGDRIGGALHRCAAGADCCDACRGAADEHEVEDEKEDDELRERSLARVASRRSAMRTAPGPRLQRVGDFENARQFEGAAGAPGTLLSLIHK
jgi:hypothetical protein